MGSQVFDTASAVIPQNHTPIGDMIQKNATSSPLLRLPCELRDGIWREVFSNKAIHIFLEPGLARSSHPRTCSRHFPVSDQVSRLQRHTLFTSASVARNLSYGLWSFISAPRNSSIPAYEHGTSKGDWPWRNREKEFLWVDLSLPMPTLLQTNDPLAFLGACRQMHEEGSLAVFASNLFCFRAPIALATFLQSRSVIQKQALRRLTFNFDHHEFGFGNCSLISPQLLSSLPNLHTIHVKVPAANYQKSSSALSNHNRPRRPGLDVIVQQFSLLNANSVVVMHNLGADYLAGTPQIHDETQADVAEVICRSLLDQGSKVEYRRTVEVLRARETPPRVDDAMEMV